MERESGRTRVSSREHPVLSLWQAHPQIGGEGMSSRKSDTL